jgi:hypothetical protein
MMLKLTLAIICFILVVSDSLSHEEKKSMVRISAFDSVVVRGFVNGGSFTNFTGPNINLTLAIPNIISVHCLLWGMNVTTWSPVMLL